MVIGAGPVGAGRPAAAVGRARRALSASTTAIIFGIVGGVEMLLFYPAGSVMDRFGRIWVAVPVRRAARRRACSSLPLTHSALAVTAVALVAAVGNGMGSGIVMTLGADSAPAVGRSQFLGGWRFVSVVGGSGSALISVVRRPLAAVRHRRRAGAGGRPAGLLGAWLGPVLRRDGPAGLRAGPGRPGADEPPVAGDR